MRAPLLAVLVALYNVLAAFGLSLTSPILPVGKVTLSVEELMVLLALMLLGIEVWRATAPTPRTAIHHVLNLLLLLAMICELAFLPTARTGLFVVLIVAVAVDLIVGTYISFITKGRNIWVSNR